MKLKGPWELYDIEADRTEQHDLIDQQPELAKELIAQWEAWAKRADVGPWPGGVRNNWGDEVKPEPKEKAEQPAKKA
jgi:arylsulfatase